MDFSDDHCAHCDAEYLLETYGHDAAVQAADFAHEADVDLGQFVVFLAFSAVAARQAARDHGEELHSCHFYSVLDALIEMIERFETQAERGMN